MVLKIARSLAVGVFLFGIANIQAAPQDRDHDRDDRGWYQNRDSFYHGEGWKMRLFDRVRDDLNRVQEVDFNGRDQYRIERTKQELNELQGKLASQRYDQPELDDVIGALNGVVAANQLSPRDRDMLNDDLARLREYREHHEDWR
ncbi:MAG TPA: hypothetical protein VK789_11880 [Bryobacteraceae bacterium]|jgi:hypothetical protein|nr:hypothetical protein [Bryobacteraceae bacterium]